MKNTVPPLPSMLTAIPARMISVFSFRAKKPIIRAVSIPSRMAQSRPIQALWVQAEKMTPVRAEIIMIPSRPMLVTPARSATTAARAAKRMGVVMRKMEKTKASEKMMPMMLCNITPQLLSARPRLSFPRSPPWRS